ncbi:hypothetical protein [Deinococcus misasensis]|uniref:hypothetical protein n=1 Tax=Deinococcus misasensis TaxID=392413 RepID=UPI00054DEBB6|nr:hypothetical protein [Deinococcus misasensis]
MKTSIPRASEALKAVQSIEHEKNEQNMAAISQAIQLAIGRCETEVKVNELRPVVREHLENLGYMVHAKCDDDRGITSKWWVISWSAPII